MAQGRNWRTATSANLPTARFAMFCVPHMFTPEVAILLTELLGGQQILRREPGLSSLHGKLIRRAQIAQRNESGRERPCSEPRRASSGEPQKAMQRKAKRRELLCPRVLLWR